MYVLMGPGEKQRVQALRGSSVKYLPGSLQHRCFEYIKAAKGAPGPYVPGQILEKLHIRVEEEEICMIYLRDGSSLQESLHMRVCPS